MTSRRCTATCADGSPCRAWAVHGTDPPRCAPHGGGKAPVGAPAGNQNALTHGYYAAPSPPARPDHHQAPSLSQNGDDLFAADLPAGCTIDAIIHMLYHKQVALDDYIDRLLRTGTPSIYEFIHLLRIHGQNASRLGRLLRDRRALSGEAADGISGAIAQALDELHSELRSDPT
jgi:hypothetical protein